MVNANYRKGADFERATIKHLKEHDYYCIRSAGSHSKVDIVALGNDGEILLIQNKLDSRISPSDRAELINLARRVYATPLVAYKLPRNSQIFYKELFGVGVSDSRPWLPPTN